MFEIQSHPRCGPTRSRSAFLMLDSLIRSLGLTTLDIDDPRVTVFAPGSVPIVPPSEGHSPGFNLLADPSSLLPGAGSGYEAQGYDGLEGDYARAYGSYGSHVHDQPHRHAYPLVQIVSQPDPMNPVYNIDYSDPYSHAFSYSQGYEHEHEQPQWQCGCSAYSLGNHWPLAFDLTPAWTNMPMWPHDAEGGAEGEMVKEECRRLVWSTVMLTVTHSTKTTAGTNREPQHLWIKDPANVRDSAHLLR